MENFYKWEIFLLETLKPPKKEKNKQKNQPSEVLSLQCHQGDRNSLKWPELRFKITNSAFSIVKPSSTQACLDEAIQHCGK